MPKLKTVSNQTGIQTNVIISESAIVVSDPQSVADLFNTYFTTALLKVVESLSPCGHKNIGLISFGCKKVQINK